MTNEETLDGRYLDWLYKSIGLTRNRNPARSHWKLAEQLFKIPFEWTVPNDDNRVEDGKDLRQEFLEEDGAEGDKNWLELDCSVLELLIALSRRLAFESEEDSYTWFWRMMENLGLDGYTDTHYDAGLAGEVEEIIDIFIHREYERDGSGGLFPLRQSKKDQRKVELWYQMSSYLLENEEYGLPIRS